MKKAKFSGYHNRFPNNRWFLRVSSTRLSNTVGKGEIARNEFLHASDDDAKAITIPRVFSENSQAKNEDQMGITQNSC